MKILILANFDVGLYQFRRELIAALLKEHQVLISLPDGDLVRPLEVMGCRFCDTPMDRRGINPVTDLKLFARYLKLLRQEKPDLVITYTIKPNIYGGMACRLQGLPYAANITGLGTAFQKQGALRKLVTLLYKLALKRAKIVFFENRGNMQTLLAEKIVSTDRCQCLNGAGINLNAYPPVPYPDHSNIRFLYLGRIMKEKGMDELFSAMRRLYAELGERVHLDLVGFFDDDYEAEIQALVADGIADFHGFQTDPRPYYANADCVTLPSYHEGLSNVLLEAAATGRPVITTDIHGCKETVDPGVSGLLCHVQDADSLYRQMRTMASLSPVQRRDMGLAARKKVEREFEKQMVVDETLKALGL